MSTFKVVRNTGYTVMSNHHLRNKNLSLKAKGLLSQMLSLPDDWDYTLRGLAFINKESIDAIRTAVLELEKAGYINRVRPENNERKLFLTLTKKGEELREKAKEVPAAMQGCIPLSEDKLEKLRDLLGRALEGMETR